MEFVYDASWVAMEGARPISLSLPMNLDGLPLKGEKVGFFFDNLLPDSDTIRPRIRNRFTTRSGDAFDLLEAVGRDCVGALQLLPEGRTPEGVFTIDATPLTDREIEKLLLGAVSSEALVSEDDDFRISIAGAQEKTALLWHEGRWCKPHGATPTTHIFKLAPGLVGGRQLDLRESLENEWRCAQLLTEYGVPVASCEAMAFGSGKALVVTRFDRVLHSSGRYWLRLPQEDFHPKKLKLAMAVHGESKHCRVEEITRRHFSLTAHRCGLGPNMEPDIITKTPTLIAAVGARLPKSFPEKFFRSVTTGLQKAAQRLGKMAAE